MLWPFHPQHSFLYQNEPLYQTLMCKILIFLLLGFSCAKAQQLSGYIVEAGSGEAIIGAIAIDSLANNFATIEFSYASITI